MGKSKRAIYWAIMCILLAIITTACGLTIVHSSKVATLTLDQTVTYNAPTNIPVTFLANGGEFSGGGNTINETIKINTLSGTSIFPTNPTRTGYTFAGWEYSVDGTSYSDYALSSDMPFTEHLYVRAKWEEVTIYVITVNKITVGGSYTVQCYYQFKPFYDSLTDDGWTSIGSTNSSYGTFDTSSLSADDTIFIKLAIGYRNVGGNFSYGSATLTEVRNGRSAGDDVWIFSLTNLTGDVTIDFWGSGQGS